MTNAKYRYWQRKNNGLCVACGIPVDKGATRCRFCMKKLSVASQESTKRKLEELKAKAAEVDALRARVAELESMLSESSTQKEFSA